VQQNDLSPPEYKVGNPVRPAAPRPRENAPCRGACPWRSPDACERCLIRGSDQVVAF